jgi:hypothetical protein
MCHPLKLLPVIILNRSFAVHAAPARQALIALVVSARLGVGGPALTCCTDVLAEDSGARCTVQQEVPAELPLVENLGQWPADIRFAAFAAGTVVRLEGQSIGLQLSSPGGESLFVRLAFQGACSSAITEGDTLREGRYNYYLGSDPQYWISGARGFGRARIRGLYAGIDLLLQAEGTRLEYDLLIDAGVDPSRVRLRIEGVGSLRPLREDQWCAESRLGELLHTPVKSFDILPSGQRRELDCAWVDNEDGSISPRVPEHDLSLPLIIDPELSWSTYLHGSSGGSSASALAWDHHGDLYVAGNCAQIGFPVTPGAFQAPSGVISNCYATKFRVSDGTLLFSSIFGGNADPGHQGPIALAWHHAGTLTVVGATNAADFPVTPGAFDTSFDFAYGSFVTQLSAADGSLVFSSRFDAPLTFNEIDDVCLSHTGSILLAGGMSGPNFPTTAGAFQPQPHSRFDSEGFVCRMDPTGSYLEWGTLLGGSAGEGVTAVKVDARDAVTVVGRTASHDFPTTTGTFQPTMSTTALTNAFVARIAARGDRILWSSYLGGSGGTEIDDARSLDLDSFGNVYLAGDTDSATFPTTTGAFQTRFPVHFGQHVEAGWAASVSGDGSRLLWCTFLTTAEGGGAEKIVVDGSGVPTVSGVVTGNQLFPMTPGAYDTAPPGDIDIVVARLSPDGGRLFYATYVGGPRIDLVEDLALSPTSQLGIAGYVYNPGGYPVTANAFQSTFGAGGVNAVLSVLDLVLQGVDPYGRSTPACRGPLSMNVTEMPAAGASNFGCWCSGAPALANGFLLIGERASSPTPIAGMHVWIDVSRPFSRISVRSDDRGYVERSLPIPAGTTGRSVAMQFVFSPATTCPGAGWSASKALHVTVQ